MTLSLLLVSSLASTALADTAGSSGYVTDLEVNTTAADAYLINHGRVVISGKQSTEYRWGGTSCGSRTLSADQVTMLQRALESNTRILPSFQIGQGEMKCLVGFRLASA